MVRQSGRQEWRIINRNNHLNAYEIVTDPEPSRYVRLENQFGEQKLLIQRPALLLVPAYKIEPTMLPPDVDHFKCYEVVKGEPVNREVDLKDQFDGESTFVGRPLFFCVPVEKLYNDRIEPVKNPDAHLTIYEIKPRGYDLGRTVEDQFRRGDFKVLRSSMLGVPSLKLEWGLT